MTAEQLKNSILQMAVSGKLVPQDPNDEPASVLLERIRKEKEQLIKEGKIKKEKNPSYVFRGADNTPYEKVGNNAPVNISDKAPFEIPDTWEWCRVGDLFSNMSGLAYKKDSLNKKSDSMVRVLRGGNIGNESYFFKEDDVFIDAEFVKPELYLRKNYMITPAVSSLEHIGKIALISQDYKDAVVGGFVLMLLPFFHDDDVSNYLLYAFAAKHHRDNCRSITHKSGQAFYNMSRESLMNLPVPLPPKNEMKRIVEKLKSILPYISEYAEKESELSTLNISFPDSIKKSILQQAVQGKLVPQDPEDEPAAVLLERIRSEKERLIAEGKIKRDKNESVIFRRDNSHYEKLNGVERCIDDEVPFEIPDSWAWSRLKNLVYLTSGGQYPESRNGCLYVKVADMNLPENSSEIVTSTRKTTMFDTGNIPTYSIIFPKRGGAISTNKKRIVMNEPICIDSNTMSMTVLLPAIFDYLRIWFEGVDLGALQSGTSVPQINNKDLEPLLIPLPPIEEQPRIVGWVREALTWIGQM